MTLFIVHAIINKRNKGIYAVNDNSEIVETISMATRKAKKYSKKQLEYTLALCRRSATNLLNDVKLRDKYLIQLEKKITGTVVKIERLESLPMLIKILNDACNKSYKRISSECLIDIAGAISYVLSCKGISKSKARELSKVDTSAIVGYVSRKHKTEIEKYRNWEKWEKPGIYPLVPSVVIDEKEQNSIELLTKRYEKLIEPTAAAKLSKKIKDKVPEKLKKMLEDAGGAIQNADLYDKVMKMAADGFDILISNSAKVTVSEKDVIKQINSTMKENRIFKLEDACYARGYDIAKLVNRFKTQNVFVALAEGGSTGLLGLAGIPFNLATSLFIFYRSVQSIAMFYGYDVKNNADELEIATNVFMEAMDPQKGSGSEMGDMIAKVMAMSEALVVKETVNKGWQAMAEHGGVTLLLTQIRALAHASAKKALTNAGKKGLEPKLFEGVLKALGKKFTQEAIEKAATPAAAAITALMDVSTMNRVIEYADVFYNKRFLAEKQVRIELCENPHLAKDVEYEVIKN